MGPRIVNKRAGRIESCSQSKRLEVNISEEVLFFFRRGKNILVPRGGREEWNGEKDL